MKLFSLLMILLLLMACTQPNQTQQQTVAKYYQAFDQGDYPSLRKTIADTLTLISGDYTTHYTPQEFYSFFKWDSVFKPSYNILTLDRKKDVVLATIAQNNLRNGFLKHNPLIFKVKISFTGDKISGIEELAYTDVDWGLWGQQRDSLTQWISNYHQHLDGFVNDMSMQGAINYLEAITLYNNKAHPSVYQMWSNYLAANPAIKQHNIPDAWFFHNNEADANRLAQLVANGQKQASTGLYAWYQEAGAALPQVGSQHIITDFKGQARAIIKLTAVDTIPFDQITSDYAALDMGTHNNPLQQWKKAHWEFFTKALASKGKKPSTKMLVVCERFTTVWPKPSQP